MSKHTPGEWGAWYDEGGRVWDVSAPYQVYRDQDGSATEFFPAEERYSVLDDPTKQDAHLISAAPELLAALEWAMENLDEAETCVCCEDRRKRARAALAKARGEA